MADLRARLRILDDAPVPEQWEDIRRRPAGSGVQGGSDPARRATAALVGLIVALAGTFFAVARLTPGPEGSMLDMTAWTPARVEALGLTFRYPPAWHVQPFDELVGRAGFAGAVVSNVDHTFTHPDLGANESTTAWDLRNFPDDAVAISIERVDAIAVPREDRDTELPLDLARARHFNSYRPGSGWIHLWLPFVLDGRHGSVRVWFGPDASEQDREVARRIVASIAPLGTPRPIGDERIAFSAYSAGQWQIFSARPDGSERSQLTSLPTNQFHPDWSPDGRRIAFSAQNADGDMEIHVMDADGSDIDQLTRGEGWNYLPAWSPDASRIVFVSSRDGNDEIYVMNADGSNQIRLTDDPDEDLSPVWSPDGSWIAFQSNRAGGNDIFVVAPNGTRVRNLTDMPGSGEFDPAWSPDGAKIAFASDRDGNPEIYVMNADGSGVVRLTNDPAHDWNPAWAPDGSRIAFESDRDGRTDVFTVELDGTEPVKLTDAETDACCPTWQLAARVG